MLAGHMSINFSASAFSGLTSILFQCWVATCFTLKTSEGAYMSPEDKIVDVLSSNEEVIASVESWDLPTLSERYRDACMNTNTGKLIY